MRGSGRFFGFDFPSETCNISIDGSGDMEVLVNDRLNVDIDGSADIYYRGTPSLSINNNGSGKVIDAN